MISYSFLVVVFRRDALGFLCLKSKLLSLFLLCFVLLSVTHLGNVNLDSRKCYGGSTQVFCCVIRILVSGGPIFAVESDAQGAKGLCLYGSVSLHLRGTEFDRAERVTYYTDWIKEAMATRI